MPSKDGRLKPRVAEQTLPVAMDGQILVQPGDTVYSISRREKVPISAIVRENSLKRPYILQAGTRIRIPDMADYTVQPGDTYETVAARAGTPVEELADINSDVQTVDLPPLQPGDTIRVPAGTAQSQPLAAIDAPAGMVAQPVVPPYRAPAVEPVLQQGDTKYTLVPMGPTTSEDPLPEHTAGTQATGKFAWPLEGRVLQFFNASNGGINIGAPSGTPITAAASGTVISAGENVGALGKVVLIRHEGGYVTTYGHLDRVLVDADSIVAQNDVIGTVGKSGGVKTPQLHFEIRQGDSGIDPLPMLPKR